MKNKKRTNLYKGILYDLIGMATMAIPVIGPFLDMGWAPVAASQMNKMYPGKKGKLASVLVFIEEILPFTDIVPSFTLMWIYTYVISAQPEDAVVLQAEVIDN
ncbi:MAG: hypothetical protein CL868_20465 [Cytophagaceae bacterium]|nr:hypothetical protein [Cytophagaceae bacterium]|tara:strand:- start:2001 stop:2309 length:309 start_codon:yes stop_codon:yes gene_type:complete